MFYKVSNGGTKTVKRIKTINIPVGGKWKYSDSNQTITVNVTYDDDGNILSVSNNTWNYNPTGQPGDYFSGSNCTVTYEYGEI
jgi:hypothetical protein